MKKFSLGETMLFRNESEEEIESMLNCLGAEQKSFEKGEIILQAGEPVSSMGLVLSGRVQIYKDDFWGNRNVMDSVGTGAVFAEAYACIPGEPLLVSAVAAEPCEILFLNAGKLLAVCPNACPRHSRLVRNLLAITARKNLKLSQKIFHTAAKTIRGRLVSYLSSEAARQGGSKFVIPFNRQQLADYLGVDRSALSNELGKMQREGLLKTERNHFEIFSLSAED